MTVDSQTLVRRPSPNHHQQPSVNDRASLAMPRASTKSESKKAKPRPSKRRRDSSEDAFDSDALDDSDVEPKSSGKRKMSPSKSKASRKKRKTDEDEDYSSEVELKEGQEIVGRVIRAPTEGLVPPGQVSQNTLDFLAKLKDPKCNDREWYVHNTRLFVSDLSSRDLV